MLNDALRGRTHPTEPRYRPGILAFDGRALAVDQQVLRSDMSCTPGGGGGLSVPARTASTRNTEWADGERRCGIAASLWPASGLSGALAMRRI